MLRIEVTSASSYRYDVTLFEKRLRWEFMKLAAELAEAKNVDLNRIQFSKPK